jgi:uncharacterized protein
MPLPYPRPRAMVASYQPEDAVQAPVQIAFGDIRHTRLKPTRHAFAYRGFFLRLRIDALDSPRAIEAALAQAGTGRWFGIERAAPLSFRAADHGDGSTPLAEWVRGLVASAGVVADGPIWLHCFARVLGYTFKPVSFWFCHRADGRLAAVVAEVNNTFGERHCYLLAEPDGAPLAQGRELQAQKVFHVSPFCAVEGNYRFRFFNRADRVLARIDYDDAEGPLLVTSLSGAPQPLSRSAVRRALFGHPLFTLGVIARIHWHALRLWLARVPFHRKPAPPRAFVSRGYR